MHKVDPRPKMVTFTSTPRIAFPSSSQNLSILFIGQGATVTCWFELGDYKGDPSK